MRLRPLIGNLCGAYAPILIRKNSILSAFKYSDLAGFFTKGIGQLGLHLSHLGLRRLHRHEARLKLRTPLREVAIKGGNLAVQSFVRIGVGLELVAELPRLSTRADVGLQLIHKGCRQAHRARGGIVKKFGDIRRVIGECRIERGISDRDARIAAREIQSQRREILDRAVFR